jgi:hypothetical protein
MILVIVDGVRTIIKLLCDLVTFIWLMLRPHGALAAENLFLRKQISHVPAAQAEATAA